VTFESKDSILLFRQPFSYACSTLRLFISPLVSVGAPFLPSDKSSQCNDCWRNHELLHSEEQ
jgi:hypothetical protein